MIQLVAQAREGESQGDVRWTSKLWTVVASMVRRGELAPGLGTALEAHGYGGGDPARAGVPDLATLKQTLATMGATVETTPVAQAPQLWSAGSRYAQDLPAEVRRAGPEIYRNLRKSHVSARDWLKQYYPDSTTAMGTQWVDLWGAAMAVDLRLQQSARAEGWAGVQETLATDDLVESHLRRLFSGVYGSKTGDWGSFDFMLAVQPSNLARDADPSGLSAPPQPCSYPMRA